MKPCYLPVQCPCPWSNVVSRINQNSNFLPCRCRQQKRTEEERPEPLLAETKLGLFKFNTLKAVIPCFRGGDISSLSNREVGMSCFRNCARTPIPGWEEWRRKVKLPGVTDA